MIGGLVWVSPASAGFRYTPRLMVSPNADRSGATLLEGASPSGHAHIFVRPGRSAISQVVFTLDPGTAKARETVENFDPYDFAGTLPDGTAWPLDTASLASGSHRMTAVVKFSGGGERTLSASFNAPTGVTPPPAPTTTTAPPSTTATTTPPTTAPPTTTTTTTTTTTSAGGGTLPTSPPAICGNSLALSGPSTPPTGAITVPAGDNSSFNFGQAGKTFWFAPGTHTFGSGQYGQIIPASNATYIGAPGAVLDGRGVNRYAFTQQATGVTIKYLTIQNFGGPGSNNNEGVVNHDGGTGWKIQNNTIQRNGGAGVFIGSDNVVSNNCLKENGQYGFSMYKPTSRELRNITLDRNEIVGNNTDDWEAKINGCGCTGGGKFWDAHTVRVTNNYVHHNKSVGLWADTNNYDFLFEGNWIEGNDGQAIFYETSYNAAIRNNVIKGNGLVSGGKFAARGDNFPEAAVYISESGGDSRLPYGVAGSPAIDISGNLFVDNWSGVTVWENADRYCNSAANTSTGYCTIVNPSVTLQSCVSGTISKEPYYSDCRWKSQNVRVTKNDFRINRASVNNCDPRYCGRMAVLSNWGTYPDWSPYKADVIQKAITFNQHNVWSGNSYTGSWSFVTQDTSNTISSTAWRSAPYNQDAGSTFTG